MTVQLAALLSMSLLAAGSQPQRRGKIDRAAQKTRVAHDLTPLLARIQVPKKRFHLGEQITFQLTIENRSAWAIPLVRPRSFSGAFRTVDFFVVDLSTGHRIERVSHMMHTIILIPPIAPAIMLEPRAISASEHEMLAPVIETHGWQQLGGVPAPPTAEPAKPFALWSYSYPEGKRRKFERVLRPGRYLVLLRYSFFKEPDWRFWPDELASEYGDVWQGELLSNEVEIIVSGQASVTSQEQR